MKSEQTSFFVEAPYLHSFSPTFSSIHVWTCLERRIQHWRQSLPGCYDNTFFLSPGDPSPSEFSVACHTSETCSIKVWAVNSDFSLSQTGRECSRKLFLRLGLLWKIKGSYECFVSKGCLSLLVSVFYRDNLGIGITGVASSFWQSETFSSLKQ